MAQTKDASNDKKNKDSLKIGAQGPNKIVIRRLPPTLSSEVFLQQVSPLPEFSYYYFVSGELSDCPFSRAYFYFVRNEDVMIFQEKFDGYVFLDEKGNEYPAVVEYAPYNKVPKAKVKIDPKAGTIEYDPDYLKFLDALEKCDQENVPTPESLLEDIEAKEKLVKCSPGFLKMSTPLIDFLNKRREDKRQAQLMKAKQKEEERRKRQALKEQNKAKTKEKCQDDADQDPVKEHDQEKAKVLSKSSKGATSKTQISEDLKLRDWVSDREHFQKSKYEPQKKREEIFKKGKSKYSSFPKDKRDEYDTKPKIEKHVPKNGESESNSGKWSSLESNSIHSKDSRQEPASEALQKKNKMAVEIQDYKKDENYKAVDRRETESKQRIRYKDRPERPIYRPGHKKEKQEEQRE